MRRTGPVLAAIVAFALGTACASTRREAAAADDASAAFVPEADRWKDIMEDVVGPIYDDYLVREAERTSGPMNLDAVAAQATRAANHMALGYGVHEWKTVPGFAGYARDAETWLREIAARAAAGETDAVATLILDGELQHCDRCHAAAR